MTAMCNFSICIIICYPLEPRISFPSDVVTMRLHYDGPAGVGVFDSDESQDIGTHEC